jgi:hypothetical protein
MPSIKKSIRVRATKEADRNSRSRLTAFYEAMYGRPVAATRPEPKGPDGCCPGGLCSFRPDRTRLILNLIKAARRAGNDPVEYARSYLKPRGERTMGRSGLLSDNVEEDAVLDVVAVMSAIKAGADPKDIDALARSICPYSAPRTPVIQIEEKKKEAA